MKLKLKSKINWKFFQPVEVRMLVDISSIVPDITSFGDENITAGEHMNLSMYPNGKVNLLYGRTVYLSETYNYDNVVLEEDVHFELI